MSIVFRCQYCHKEIKAPDNAGGKQGKCPFCSKNVYVPAPVSEEDILPLAPIDEREEAQRKQEIASLLARERDILAETGGPPPEPLEQREKVSAEDVHHLVVNYCLDFSAGNLDRAAKHVAELSKFGPAGKQAIADFMSGKAVEPALDPIPSRVLQGFLKQLLSELG